MGDELSESASAVCGKDQGPRSGCVCGWDASVLGERTGYSASDTNCIKTNSLPLFQLSTSPLLSWMPTATNTSRGPASLPRARRAAQKRALGGEEGVLTYRLDAGTLVGRRAVIRSVYVIGRTHTPEKEILGSAENTSRTTRLHKCIYTKHGQLRAPGQLRDPASSRQGSVARAGQGSVGFTAG